MSKRESGIQSAIIQAATGHWGAAIYIRVTHGTAYAVAGDPDVYGCLSGWFFGIEVKNETGVLTAIQRYRLKEIRAAGGRATGVSDVDDAMTFLRETIIP